MKWKDAKIACAKLGKGWRLPTNSELSFIRFNPKKGEYIDKFGKDRYYWGADFNDGSSAWAENIAGSGIGWWVDINSSLEYARAVRSITTSKK